MAYPHVHRPYTWEEFLKLEASSDTRYEYHDGIIVAMAGASNRHNDIATNLTAFFKPKLRGKGCKYHTETVRLFRHNSERYLYPDGMITCRPLDMQTANGIRSPLLVIEILSRRSRDDDRSFKLREYLKLPSLQHYVLIEQSHADVQHYQRIAGDTWQIHFHQDLEEAISLPEIGITLTLADIYSEINFDPPTYVREEIPEYGEEK